MSNSKKIPTWVLFDQLHIDVNINTSMTAKDRKQLKELLNSETLMRFFQWMIQGPDRKNIKVEITR